MVLALEAIKMLIHEREHLDHQELMTYQMDHS